MISLNCKILKLFLLIILFGVFSINLFAQSRIALLYSGYTEKSTDIYSPKIIDEITQWELFLIQENISYSVIYDKNLESGISDDYDILIFPSVNAVSNDEAKSIAEFMREGNSVLSVGSKLNLGENGYFSKTNNVLNLFGIFTEEYLGKEKSITHYLNFDPAFEGNMQYDGLLQVSTKNLPLLTIIQTLKNVSLGSCLNNKTSMVYGANNSAKFVWIGYSFSDIVGGKEDIDEFENFIVNSLKWLDKNPDVYLDNFPEGKNSATFILIENNLELKYQTIDQIIQKGIQPYIVISSGQEISDEIKNRLDGASYILDLTGFVNENDGKSRELLDKILMENEKLNTTIKTILAPKDLLSNQDIISSLSEIGINVILYQSNYFGLPTIKSNDIIAIPYFPNNKEYSNGRGIKILTYKPKIVCDKNLDDEFLLLVSQLKSSDSWLTSFSDLRNWWLNKENISVSVNARDEKFIDIIITNNNLQDVKDVTINFNCAQNFDPISFSIDYSDGFVDYLFGKANEINFKIDKIFARQTQKIRLKLEN